MPIGTSRPIFGGGGSSSVGRGVFRHQVFDITAADVLRRDFRLEFVAVAHSPLVMRNLGVLCPSEENIPRDYAIIDDVIVRLVSDFVLLPGDRIHVYYQPL
jgi:hypothetical protein